MLDAGKGNHHPLRLVERLPIFLNDSPVDIL